MQRISLLHDEVGKELDRLGASFRQARYVAYGQSRTEQRRRLDKVREELQPKPRPIPLAKAKRSLKGVRVPQSLRSADPEELQRFVRQVLRKASGE